MAHNRLPHRAAIFAAACFTLSTTGAQSQESYPTRPVRLVVASAPGGGTDTTARIISPKVAELLGKPIVVENRPGAAAIVGTEYVANAAPDGYTLLIVPSTITIVPSTYLKPSVPDPVKSFAPITQVLEVPQMLVSHPSLPTKNLREIVALAKSSPGKLDYAAGSHGSNPHMAMMLLLTMSATDMHHIPFKSGNGGLNDAIAGHIPIMMGNILAVLPHVKTGRFRAYGVTTAKRAVAAPDIPTIAESGLPGYESVQWFGVLAPAGTPREIVVRLHRDFVRVIDDADTRQRFVSGGAEARTSGSPEEFGSFMRVEVAKWAKVVERAKMRKQ